MFGFISFEALDNSDPDDDGNEYEGVVRRTRRRSRSRERCRNQNALNDCMDIVNVSDLTEVHCRLRHMLLICSV